jgi:hypothetical protein
MIFIDKSRNQAASDSRSTNLFPLFSTVIVSSSSDVCICIWCIRGWLKKIGIDRDIFRTKCGR